ncbi:extracellular solute-binding protein [Marinilactibacillus sp. XAAS-LB27]|uniref:extracellular solute-binding protein n=1 Tax=Marinilactibacillus sp. XAAS-LB27 TaxID=3114538 RepID=UPI002E1992EC|nr:extracellular solute-binding protein [Marinilactibacillus sp. XAAS-LB27]
MQKKTIVKSLVLSSVLVLSACGGGNGNSGSDDAQDVEVATEGFPIVDEEITLNLMAPGTGNQWESMPTMTEYEELTGINLEYTTPPMDDFGTRFNLTFASGDLPDIIFAPGSDVLTPALEVDYGQQGLLVPLNDLIEDYAPNLNALLDENPELRSSITTPDGNIYALPRVNEGDTAIWPIGPLWYNGSWLDALDEDVPETLDEFYDLMVRFRDDDPNGTGQNDTIPISNGGLENARIWFLSAFDLNSWDVEAVDGEVRYNPTTDNARAYYEYFTKLYSEGIVDQEIFSQSDEMKKAKGQQNVIGLFTDYFSFFTTGRSEDEALNDPMFMPLTSEWSPERSVAGSPRIARGTFAITSANQYPEATMRWVDQMYSEEGAEYFDRGPEGYYWEWEDGEGSTKIYTEEAEAEGEDYRGTITPFYGINTPGLGAQLPPIGGEESDFTVFIRESTQNNLEPYAEVAFPLVYLEQDEIDELQSIQGDVATYIEEQEAQFITGQMDVSDDAVWDNYLSTLENMGIERYVEIYQAAYDRNQQAAE